MIAIFQMLSVNPYILLAICYLLLLAKTCFLSLVVVRLVIFIEQLLGSNTYLAKVDRSTQKPRGTPLSRPC